MLFRRNTVVLSRDGRLSSAAADAGGNVRFFIDTGAAIEERVLESGRNQVRSGSKTVSYADDACRVLGGVLERRAGTFSFRQPRDE